MCLVGVADRNGLSSYGYDKSWTLRRCPLDDDLVARHGLRAKPRSAFDGPLLHVLSLPDKPVGVSASSRRTPEPMHQGDPAPRRQSIRHSLGVEDA